MRRRDQRIIFALSLFVESETDLSVGQWAAAAGLSPVRFSQLFYFHTGMLPREFIQMMRQFRDEQMRATEILDGVEHQRIPEKFVAEAPPS